MSLCLCVHHLAPGGVCNPADVTFANRAIMITMALSVTRQGHRDHDGPLGAGQASAGKTSAGKASGANRAIMIMMALSVIQKHSDLENKRENIDNYVICSWV